MKLLLTLLLFTYVSAFSRELTTGELDSLFSIYVKIKNPALADARVTADTGYQKCGFRIVNTVRLNFDKFTEGQQNVLLKIFERPSSQKEVVTPAGHFRVHYDTSGIHALKYDLNLLMQALDSSYNFEVHYLGYAPPRDNNSGGDDKYDIYIRNVGSLYGYTEHEDRISGNTYTSFMVIDNEFSHTGTRGIDGARVTVAHELHHGIQIGNYAYKDNDIFFHELSSTAMEEFVFDNINDYYYYMDDFFNSPDISFPSHSGYDLAVWNIYLQKIYDYSILKKQWEHIPDMRALDAVALSISEKGSNFQDLYNKFGIWLYFTGYRAAAGKYFDEALNYPVIQYLVEREYVPPSDTLSLNIFPASHNYITLYNKAVQGGADTLTILISNSDYKKAITDPSSVSPVKYELYSDSAEGLQRLADNYFKRFTAQSSIFFAASEFLNNQLVSEGFVRIESESAFPLPFRYNLHSFIYFPVKMNFDREVELNIYSSSMDLVYSSRKDIFNMFGRDMISWNGKDSRNHKLGSGVYLYIIKSGEDYSKGKIVLFND